jgi:hypothetical protein
MLGGNVLGKSRKLGGHAAVLFSVSFDVTVPDEIL